MSLSPGRKLISTMMERSTQAAIRRTRPSRLTSDGKRGLVTLIPDETAGIPPTPSQPVTSGLLATLRLLRASGGGLFKAFRWQFLSNCVVIIVFACLSSVPHLPYLAASIIASLAATKVETAWTHAAVSSSGTDVSGRSYPATLRSSKPQLSLLPPRL